MAINPQEINTTRTGELANNPISITDYFAHEVNGILKKCTGQELATFIGSNIIVEDGVGFRNTQINDGDILPLTTEKEFILVGKGTFYNVNGGDTIVTSELLNVLVSNGVFWSLGVEIPINPPPYKPTPQRTPITNLTTNPQDFLLPSGALPSQVVVNNIIVENWSNVGNLVTLSYPLTGEGFTDQVVIYYQI